MVEGQECWRDKVSAVIAGFPTASGMLGERGRTVVSGWAAAAIWIAPLLLSVVVVLAAEGGPGCPSVCLLCHSCRSLILIENRRVVSLKVA